MKTLLLLSCGILLNCELVFAQTNWSVYANNPIIGPSFIAGAVTYSFVPVILRNGVYHMYMTVKYSGTEKMGHATSSDGTNWTLVSATMIDSSSDPSRFDYNKVSPASIVDDGDTLRMWYQGHNEQNGKDRIGYAWSTDGNTWTKVNGPASGQSVMDQSMDSANAFSLALPAVIKKNGIYHMWYSRLDLFTSPSIYVESRIGYATSPDGIHWTRVKGACANGAVMDFGPTGSADAGGAMTGCVLSTSSGFEMWYMAMSDVHNTFGLIMGTNTGGCRMGYATSSDGIVWNRVTGSGTFGAICDSAWAMSVMKSGSGYKMWYSPITQKAVGYATSGDVTGLKRNISSLTPKQSFILRQEGWQVSAVLISRSASSSMMVYGTNGQIVKKVPAIVRAEHMEYHWSGTDMAGKIVAPGIYVITINANSGPIVNKIKLIR